MEIELGMEINIMCLNELCMLRWNALAARKDADKGRNSLSFSTGKLLGSAYKIHLSLVVDSDLFSQTGMCVCA